MCAHEWRSPTNSTRQSDVMGKMSPPTSLLGGGIHEYVFTYNHLLVCLVAARYRNTLEPILGRIFEEVIWFSCLSRVSLKRPCLSKMSPRKIVNACLTRVETCHFHSHIFHFQSNKMHEAIFFRSYLAFKMVLIRGTATYNYFFHNFTQSLKAPKHLCC